MDIDWEKDAEGNFIVHPLTGYSTMIAAGMAIGLRLQFLRHGDQFERPSGVSQLVLTPAQPQELARALLQAAAARIADTKPSGTSN